MISFISSIVHICVIIMFFYPLLILIGEFFNNVESKEAIAIYVTYEFGTKTSCI